MRLTSATRFSSHNYREHSHFFGPTNHRVIALRIYRSFPDTDCYIPTLFVTRSRWLPTHPLVNLFASPQKISTNAPNPVLPPHARRPDPESAEGLPQGRRLERDRRRGPERRVRPRQPRAVGRGPVRQEDDRHRAPGAGAAAVLLPVGAGDPGRVPGPRRGGVVHGADRTVLPRAGIDRVVLQATGDSRGFYDKLRYQADPLAAGFLKKDIKPLLRKPAFPFARSTPGVRPG